MNGVERFLYLRKTLYDPEVEIFKNQEYMMEWFSEHCPMWPGMALSVHVTEKLLDTVTSFQRLEVFRTETYGNMLVLDGKIQCTERDEFAYHEMLVHPAMCCHPQPERVLIIGGGDGGALREVGRHPSVRKVILCEIDRAVAEAAKQFLPSMAAGFDVPEAELIFDDGIVYLEQCIEKFDVIIVDSSDPFGPAESLFGAPFYKLVRACLAPDGVVAAQSEHFFIHPQTVNQLRSAMLASFPHYAYLTVSVPSYPGGGVGIALAGVVCDPAKPLRVPDAEVIAKLRYYTPELHSASSVLPRFAAAGVLE